MSVKTEIPERATSQCAVCGNEGLEVFLVREMQIGLRERFEYGHCERCGGITRLSKVAQMSRYYPSNYYAFIGAEMDTEKANIKGWVKKQRDRSLLTGSTNPVGKLLGRFSGEAAILYGLIGLSRPRFSSRILDVGCGSGRLLRRMAEVGFQNLTGIDLFAPESAPCEGKKLRIVRENLASLKGQCFNIIMMHHSFEHCGDQTFQLKLVADLLVQDGVLLIRQPLCDSEAFRRYGVNWFQLDAPRHAILHSLNSMKLFVEKCKLGIKKIVWDSTDQQFWASEQYASNVEMYGENSYFFRPESSPFTSEQIAQWKQEAVRLNRAGLGDQAAFYIGHE